MLSLEADPWLDAHLSSSHSSPWRAAVLPRFSDELPTPLTRVPSVVRSLIAAESARDPAGSVAAYSADALWFPPAGDLVRGRAAIDARDHPMLETFKPELQVEFDEVQVSGTLVPADGGSPVSVNDEFLAVLQEEGGPW